MMNRIYLEKDAVFSSFQYTRDFLTNIYSYVPAAFGTIGGDALRSAACDEAVYVTNCHLYIVSTMVPGVLLILWMIDGIILGGYEL